MALLFAPDPKKNNEPFRHLLDAVKDHAIYMVDPDGLVGSWNAGAERVKGWRAEEVIGRSFEMFFRPEDVAAGIPRALLRTALEEGKAAGEGWRLRKGGVPFLAETVISPVWNDDGTLQGYAKVTRDITQKKSLEEMRARQARLLEIERQFRALSDSSPMLIWMTDPDGRRTYVNKTWLDFTGRTLPEELGEGWTAGIHPEDRDRLLAELDGAVRSRAPYRAEYRLRRRDGGYRWMLDTGSPRYDAEGQPLGYTGSCVDIQDRKELEEAVERSRNQLDVILRGVDDAITAEDSSGRLVFANEAAARLLGYASSDGLLADSLPDALRRHLVLDERGNPFPPDRLPGRQALQGRAGASAVVRFREIATGGERWCQVKATPVRDGEGRVTLAVSFFQDITGIKTREIQERKDKEQLRIILEGISDAILVTSAEGKVAYANHAAARFLGRASVAEVYRDVWGPGPEAMRRQIEVEDEAGRPVRHEGAAGSLGLLGEEMPPTVLRIRLARGTAPKWVVGQASPIRDERGDLQLVVQILRDITEARENEEQLRQSQKMEAVGRLAGGIAHDFNNLLTAINGYSEIGLARTAEDDPDLHGSLVEIREAGRRAAALTHQLLAFSRKQILSPKVVQINDVVERMESMLRRLIGEDIQLLSLPASGLPAIRADVSQVEQVILNLAVNARDAMPQGGALEMRTSLVENDAAFAAAHPEAQAGAHVMLSISDTGMGMDDATKARIFEPFFTTKEAGKGTGLGLATVYGIVRQSGGTLEVQSEVGKGTTFRICFPAAPREAEAIDAPETVSPADRGAGDIVMLVEDEESVRNLVCRILGDNGYVCLAAENGEQALSLGQSHPGTIGLLLTDVVLKGMSGKALADRLRLKRPALRVLYMSGYTDNALMHHGVLEPGTELINKPFSIQSLLHRVSALLQA